MSEPSPVLVEVRRGALAESRHRGSYAVIDLGGRVVDAGGDIDRPIYARSAIKPLQALPLVESGAADALGVSAEELATASASHGGELAHIVVVSGWLKRIGLTTGDLECGTHPPLHTASARALYASGEHPVALHSNCSGKHTAMLATCRHLGEATRGYIGFDHPAQRRVTRTLGEICDIDAEAAPRGIDGCGLPQLGIPLRSLALGFARFGAPANLAAGRADACKRIAAAMTAHPFLLAGTGRFCTRATEAAHGKVVLKTGAEGVYAAAIPARGLGIALKIDDGAARAAEVAMAALLVRHADLDAGEMAAFQPLLRPVVSNVAGRDVGMLEPVT